MNRYYQKMIRYYSHYIVHYIAQSIVTALVLSKHDRDVVVGVSVRVRVRIGESALHLAHVPDR